jgi:hypothetical protein
MGTLYYGDNVGMLFRYLKETRRHVQASPNAKAKGTTRTNSGFDRSRGLFRLSRPGPWRDDPTPFSRSTAQNLNRTTK